MTTPAKAIEAIGLDGATLCVFLIDANRDHPTSPIRNPGGALRAMTKRFNAGNLNIVGSLLGLARRKNGQCILAPLPLNHTSIRQRWINFCTKARPIGA